MCSGWAVCSGWPRLRFCWRSCCGLCSWRYHEDHVHQMAEAEAEVEGGAKAEAGPGVRAKVAAHAPPDHLDDGSRARGDHRRQTAQVKSARLCCPRRFAWLANTVPPV